MKNYKSKAELPKKSASKKLLFDIDYIQNSFKDAVKPYLESQKQIDKFMKDNQKAFDTLSKHANDLTKAHKMYSNTISNNGFTQVATKLQNEVKEITKRLWLPETFNNNRREVILQSPIISADKEISEDRIAELVYQKIQSKMNNDIKYIKEKSPVKLPPEAIWENIKIQFENEFDISVSYENNHIGKYDYEKLGFARKNTKEKDHDKQWELLRQLSVYANQDKIKPTIYMLKTSMKIKDNTCMQIKRNLSKKLKEIFGIKTDPFKKYNEDDGYQVKFILKTEELLRSDKDLWPTGSSYEDNVDYNKNKPKEYLP